MGHITLPPHPPPILPFYLCRMVPMPPSVVVLSFIPDPMNSSPPIPSSEQPHAPTSTPTSTAFKDTPKPPRSMPSHEQSHATTNHSTSKNTSRSARQRVPNPYPPDKPPRGEMARSGPLPAEVCSLLEANLNRSESQGIDSPILDRPLARQDDSPPPPPKDQPTSGRPSPSPAPRRLRHTALQMNTGTNTGRTTDTSWKTRSSRHISHSQ
ncbi:hypothetical protein V8E53_008616 [Lactarius tabidus]